LADGQYISINNGFTRIMGYTEADVVDKSSLELNIWAHPEDRTKLVAGLRRDGKVENMEAQFRAKDGTVRIGLMSASLIQLNNEPHIISITRDITELKRLQDELLQAEKMLSIGTLAGGIAHDFNNILNIILGYSTMLEKRRLDEQKFSESVAAITSAVDRGSALVRQILTFARKTDTAFKPLYIPDLIHELFSMLKQTFPKTISFNEKMETSLPFIYGDPSQLHQVFLNLCVNARDAMPHGGAITIRVKTWTSAQLHERFPDAVHDRYMCMSIEDTGIGMDEITRTRIFDPFFTTKESGKGTGLGLAVAYGIVQTHNGFIDVYSVQGIGTKFDIYLPVSTDVQQPQLSSASNATSNAIHGTETILIVEDEDFLLKILGSVLESHGYTVISAQDGETAVKLYQERRQEIDLVLTDMGLPKISGRDEFNMLKAINPQVNVIIASGFLEPEIKTELAAAGVREFIQKPYRPEELMQTLRQVLDSTHQKGQQP
jgi:PAS domain S-box-containing protein